LGFKELAQTGKPRHWKNVMPGKVTNPIRLNFTRPLGKGSKGGGERWGVPKRRDAIKTPGLILGHVEDTEKKRTEM